MPQNPPSGRGLLPSPTACSSDQHHAAMLADVSWHILGRTEGRSLGFGQLVRTCTGNCLKSQSSPDGHSEQTALCAGGRQWSAGPQSPSWVKVCLVSTVFFFFFLCLFCFVFYPVSIKPRTEKCRGLSIWPFLESHTGPRSTDGSRCIHRGETAGLSAVGGLAGQGYCRLGTEGLL